MPPYFDPLGETEPHTTLYTLTVYAPPRPPPRWIPDFIIKKPVTYPNTGSSHTIPLLHDQSNPKYDGFMLNDLDDMPKKVVVIKSAWFPAEMRCEHVQNGKVCEQGCYVLEKGGESTTRHWCSRSDCDGHSYCGRVVADEEGRKCFGKKGKRMVSLNKSTN